MSKKIKRTIVALGTLCMLSVTLTACGSKPEAGTAQTNAADGSQVTETGADGSQSQDDGADSPGSAETEPDHVQAAEGDTKDPQTADTDKNSVSSDSGQGNGDGTAADNGDSGKWHVLDPETAKLVDADFEGIVWKIGQDTFYLSETSTEVQDNGSLLTVSASPDSTVTDAELLQVIYNNNTRFYIRTIYDNGARYEDTEAASDALEQYASVSLKGEIEDDIFYADEVRVHKIE